MSSGVAQGGRILPPFFKNAIRVRQAVGDRLRPKPVLRPDCAGSLRLNLPRGGLHDLDVGHDASSRGQAGRSHGAPRRSDEHACAKETRTALILRHEFSRIEFDEFKAQTNARATLLFWPLSPVPRRRSKTHLKTGGILAGFALLQDRVGTLWPRLLLG